MTDAELLTPRGRRYILKADHRGRPTKHKSVWRISVQDEVACFDHAFDSDWVQALTGWGLHLVESIPAILGENLLYQVKIGKFVSIDAAGPWHGYPADYRERLQDRPPVEVLVRWRDSKIIEKHEISRVRQGKPCSLSV